MKEILFKELNEDQRGDVLAKDVFESEMKRYIIGDGGAVLGYRDPHFDTDNQPDGWSPPLLLDGSEMPSGMMKRLGVNVHVRAVAVEVSSGVSGQSGDVLEDDDVYDAGVVKSGDTRWVLISQIVLSATNPGREFCDDLVESFRAKGFRPEISRLLLRPLPADDARRSAGKEFECVAGERRWRAAAKAAMEFVPCVVAVMSDVEALEVQLIENLHREGLSVMQEADALARLLALTGEDGKPVHTAESLRDKIGKSADYVKDRLPLARLKSRELARAAGAKGTIGIAHLRRIAMLPTIDLRDEVTSLVLAPKFGPAPMPERELTAHIRDNLMRELRGARFDVGDAGLVPVVEDGGVRVAGGACTDCPLNTKNMSGDDFGAGKFAMCMNPRCYADKVAAEHEVWAASQTHGDTKALSAEENAKLWDEGGNLVYNAGLVLLEAEPSAYELKPGVEPKKWKNLIKGQPVPIVMARKASGEPVALVSKDLAVTAATKNEHHIFRHTGEAAPAPSGNVPSDQTLNTKAKRTEAEREADAARIAAEREETGLLAQRGAEAVYLAARSVKKLDVDHWREMGEKFIAWICGNDDAETVASLFGLAMPSTGGAMAGFAASEAAEGHLKKALFEEPLEKLPGLVMALGICCNYDFTTTTDEGAAERKRLAKLLGVDLKAVDKSAKAELVNRRKLAAEEKALAAGLAWSDERKKADEFEWNGMLAVNPSTCHVALPGEKLEAAVHVARDAKGWHVGWQFGAALKAPSASEPCAATETSYSNRAIALRAGLLAIADHIERKRDVKDEIRERLKRYIDRIETEGGKAAEGKAKKGVCK